MNDLILILSDVNLWKIIGVVWFAFVMGMLSVWLAYHKKSRLDNDKSSSNNNACRIV